MSFLETIISKGAEYFSGESPNELVNSIDEILLGHQKEGSISGQQRDALRHYFGMQVLSEKYGETPAWLAGVIHEEFDSILPWEGREQSRIDKGNNKVALEHYEKNIGVGWKPGLSVDELYQALEYLEIPPPPRTADEYMADRAQEGNMAEMGTSAMSAFENKDNWSSTNERNFQERKKDAKYALDALTKDPGGTSDVKLPATPSKKY